jgi:nitrogen fixation/metabolism regulation signal transduction histidine kinase
LILAGGIPTAVLSGLLIFRSPLSNLAKATIILASLVWILITAISVRTRILHHLRTLSNLIEATRNQDYSMNSSQARESGQLAGLYEQINSLINSLKVGRQSEQELLNILEKVVNQIGVAIIVCDARDKIRLVNRVASTLLKSPMEELLGVDFGNTALAALPLTVEPQLLDHRFPGGDGRWQVSQQQYRHHGEPSRIIFITDLKQVLSEEEAIAWKRLIRIVSHEVNNSLTPITSLCQTLATILAKPDSSEYASDVLDGLRVIAQRAKGLKEFISAYARIARVPEPQKTLFSVAQLIDRVNCIFPHDRVEIVGNTPEIHLFGDLAHLEQALINLIKNGIEANESNTTGTNTPAVKFSCRVRGEYCEFEVIDDGPGIRNPGNLFVPLYTTKSGGDGIGLVLCRQIAAKHFGEVTLENRTDSSGASAKLILPLPPRQD